MAGRDHSPQALSRRQFLEQMAAATLAAMATGAPRPVRGAEAGEPLRRPEPPADCGLRLLMAGGMASPETFDPKLYAPFEVGLPAAKILSTFPAIDTAVDHIKICEGLEHIAGVMDRATLVRSHVQPDLGNILHSRHQFHWHTGYVPPQTVAAPHLGSWIARMLGPRDPAIPAFIDIGQRLEGVGEKEELKAFHTAGFLGTEYGPFLLPDPDQAIEAVRPPTGMTPDRFAKRYRRYRELVRRGPLGEHSDYQQESMLRALENADRLLSTPERRA